MPVSPTKAPPEKKRGKRERTPTVPTAPTVRNSRNSKEQPTPPVPLSQDMIAQILNAVAEFKGVKVELPK